MNHLLVNSEDEGNEVIVDPHSKFGRYLADTVAAVGSDPLEILISLEDLVIEQYGEIVLRAHKAQVRIKHPRR